jgi:hypothetical protein
MPDTWERATIDEVIGRVEAQGGDPEAACVLLAAHRHHFIAAEHGALSRQDVVKLAITRLGPP